MNKTIIFTAMILVFAAGIVSASCDYEHQDQCPFGTTLISGKIFLQGTNESVGGASVSVTCVHNGTSYMRSAKSISVPHGLKGGYLVAFPLSQCATGDEVYVSASKDDLSGENSGNVRDTRLNCLDVAFVNVPLVPEFGLVIGGITALSGLVIFFFVRRN
jgi:hypothetical protein